MEAVRCYRQLKQFLRLGMRGCSSDLEHKREGGLDEDACIVGSSFAKWVMDYTICRMQSG